MPTMPHQPIQTCASWGAGLPVLLALVLPGTLTAAPAEVRGTWLTTTGPDHIRGGLNTPAVMSDLRNIGLNTVYVETWKNGYTNYPSPTLAALTGGPDRSTFLGTNPSTVRDLVQETLIHAHRNQMAYVGWFEYGFSAQFIGSGGQPSNPLATHMRDQGWLLKDQSGQYGNQSNGFAWMNPAVPEVRQFLIDITLEAIDRYDLDGVQFDDRLAWPQQFGWDSTTAAIYLSETGRSLPSSTTNSAFREWRQDKVTQFAEQFTTAVQAARPGVRVSVSPSVTNFSDVNYNAEWPQWQDAGLFDEYAPQVYRDSIASFNATIGAQLAPFGPGERDELVVGLRINGSGASTPYADLEQMIDRTRAEGVAGHSLWYSSGVRDLYGDQLTDYYDVATLGHAANPAYGPDWRPAPIVGASAAGQWAFDVTQASRYRVVGKVGSYWTELGSMPFEAGNAVLTVPGATQVELLLDRRPLDAPDFNGDGRIDAADYTLWRDTQGSSLDLRADANGDQVVDQQDYLAWRAAFGAVTAPAGLALPPALGYTSVPAPSAAALMLMAMLGLSGRVARLSES